MLDWKAAIIKPHMTILQALDIIDKSALQIGLVTDKDKLIGTITDGDARRALLAGVNLDQPVNFVMNKTPRVAHISESRDQILLLMREKHLKQIPIVDSENRLIGLETIDDILAVNLLDNWVVLMVGGQGSRLGEITSNCPKPLLRIGGKPLLETIIENFKESGFHKFFFSVNYKAEMIQEYFDDGSKWNVRIQYIKEKHKLGTAGPLSMIEGIPDEPILVMNGDLLTKVNFQSLLDYHLHQKATATMCVREHTFQVPYGVVNFENCQLTGIEEKPVHSVYINAGIYIIEPNVLSMIPREVNYNMPDLFGSLLKNRLRVSVFPIREYWIDIGRKDDLDRANCEYGEVFG